MPKQWNRRIAVVVMLALVTACTSAPSAEAQFCDRLAAATGPEGAEVLFAPGDAQRLSRTIDELGELQELAPPEIRGTMDSLVEVFTLVQTTPADDVAELIIERERSLSLASEDLTAFALDECNLFLQRAG